MASINSFNAGYAPQNDLYTNRVDKYNDYRASGNLANVSDVTGLGVTDSTTTPVDTPTGGGGGGTAITDVINPTPTPTPPPITPYSPAPYNPSYPTSNPSPGSSVSTPHPTVAPTTPGSSPTITPYTPPTYVPPSAPNLPTTSYNNPYNNPSSPSTGSAGGLATLVGAGALIDKLTGGTISGWIKDQYGNLVPSTGGNTANLTSGGVSASNPVTGNQYSLAGSNNITPTATSPYSLATNYTGPTLGLNMPSSSLTGSVTAGTGAGLSSPGFSSATPVDFNNPDYSLAQSPTSSTFGNGGQLPSTSGTDMLGNNVGSIQNMATGAVAGAIGTGLLKAVGANGPISSAGGSAIGAWVAGAGPVGIIGAAIFGAIMGGGLFGGSAPVPYTQTGFNNIVSNAVTPDTATLGYGDYTPPIGAATVTGNPAAYVNSYNYSDPTMANVTKAATIASPQYATALNNFNSQTGVNNPAAIQQYVAANNITTIPQYVKAVNSTGANAYSVGAAMGLTEQQTAQQLLLAGYSVAPNGSIVTSY